MASFSRVWVTNLYRQYNNLQTITSIGRSVNFAPRILEHSSNHPTKCAVFVPGCVSCRYSYTFLSRVTAEQLWKGVTSVSPAGRRKGRGKRIGRKVAQDLNKGQVVGFGKKNMLWPGLNAPVIRGKEVLTQQELPPDESRLKRIQELRDQSRGFKFYKIHPLERGWSGTKLAGKSLGPPNPVGDDTFEGFDSRVLEFKTVMKMSGQRGRVRSMSAFVVSGNKNGLAGFSLSKSVNGMTAANNARDRAGQVLRYIDRYEEHTVLHDFHTSFGAVNIFVKKKPKGFGLVCHRALRAICEMIGIKDIYAKVEGPTHNIQNVTKAFFIGLMKQKTPQELADEKGLHLIELRKERDFFAEVLASPRKCRTEEEIGLHETIDFNAYIHGGKVPAYVPPFKPFYINFPSYIKKKKDTERFRNHPDVRLQLVARYGSLKSFLTIREEEKAKQDVKDLVEEKEE